MSQVQVQRPSDRPSKGFRKPETWNPPLKLFRARYLLPIATPPLEDGALLIEGRRIVAVGPFAELRHASAELVDFGDAIILPPLANAHTHLELTHFPRWAEEAGEGSEPGSFVDWILRVIRVKRFLDPTRLAPSLSDGIAEALCSGTGAVGDILSWRPGREVHGTSPLRGRLFLELLGLDPEGVRQSLATALDMAVEGRTAFMEPGLAPHSPYNLTGELLDDIYAEARRRSLPVTTHLAESPAERTFLAESGGEIATRLYPAVGWGGRIPVPARRSPVEYLADRGGLFPGHLLAHGVQVGEDDVRSLAVAGVTVVLCPRSNARLGVGKAPVASYLRSGVPLALGTDSRASCDSLSVWDEIAFARSTFAGEIDPSELLDIATRGGAQALGLEGEMGVLAAEEGAHFQVLAPAALPRPGELVEFLCAPGRTGEVAALYLGGTDVLQTLGHPPIIPSPRERSESNRQEG